jgi:hypothetical protein
LFRKTDMVDWESKSTQFGSMLDSVLACAIMIAYWTSVVPVLTDATEDCDAVVVVAGSLVPPVVPPGAALFYAKVMALSSGVETPWLLCGLFALLL